MENANHSYEIILTHTFDSEHLLSSPAHLFEHLLISTIKTRFKNEIDIYGMTTSKFIKLYINTVCPLNDWYFKYMKNLLNKKCFSRKLMIQEITRINHEIKYISFLLRKNLPFINISIMQDANIFFEFNQKIGWFSQNLCLENQIEKNKKNEIILFQDSVRTRALSMIRDYVFHENIEKCRADYESQAEILMIFQMIFIEEITDSAASTISEIIKENNYLHRLVFKRMKASAVFHPEIMIKDNICTLFLYTFGLFNHFTMVASTTAEYIKSKNLQCSLTWSIISRV